MCVMYTCRYIGMYVYIHMCALGDGNVTCIVYVDMGSNHICLYAGGMEIYVYNMWNIYVHV